MMNIIHENISCCYLKQISGLFFVVYKGMHSRFTYPILRTTYQNNFLFLRVNSFRVGRCEDKWNFRAGCIEQICTYGSEFLVIKPGMPGTDIYFILSIKQILDRIKWGAPFAGIIIKQLVLVTGRVDSQTLQVSYFEM